MEREHENVGMDVNETYVSYYLSDVPSFMDLMYGHTSMASSCVVKSCGPRYRIIRYDKGIFKPAQYNTAVGLCRSVVVATDVEVVNGVKVVAMAPPKSVLKETFYGMHERPRDEGVTLETYVDGTMINVFFDNRTGEWEMATRNLVGAKSSFFLTPGVRGKSFRAMFLEAMAASELTWGQLDAGRCYSFVMQHPDNRIVVPVSKPTLYLVAVYEVIMSDGPSIEVRSYRPLPRLEGTRVMYPTRVEVDVSATWADVENMYASASLTTPYNVMGLVMVDEATGRRSKMRNPVYETVRRLRGNQPKLQYQYMLLRQKSGQVGQYLTYYPEHRADFSRFRDEIHAFTTALYHNYLDCYVFHKKTLKEFGMQFRTCLYELHHTIYLGKLRGSNGEKSRNMGLRDVIEYVNSLHPAQLMYRINYPFRQQKLDEHRILLEASSATATSATTPLDNIAVEPVST